MTWEYRCVKFPFPDDFSNALPYKQQYLDLPGQHTDLLNELGADDWEWFHTDRDLFYFRREAKPLSDDELRELAIKVASTWLRSEEVEQTLAEFIRMQSK